MKILNQAIFFPYTEKLYCFPEYPYLSIRLKDDVLVKLYLLQADEPVVFICSINRVAFSSVVNHKSTLSNDTVAFGSFILGTIVFRTKLPKALPP